MPNAQCYTCILHKYNFNHVRSINPLRSGDKRARAIRDTTYNTRG